MAIENDVSEFKKLAGKQFDILTKLSIERPSIPDSFERDCQFRVLIELKNRNIPPQNLRIFANSVRQFKTHSNLETAVALFVEIVDVRDRQWSHARYRLRGYEAPCYEDLCFSFYCNDFSVEIV